MDSHPEKQVQNPARAFFFNGSIFSLPGQSPGRAIVLPSVLASALMSALVLALASVLAKC